MQFAEWFLAAVTLPAAGIRVRGTRADRPSCPQESSRLEVALERKAGEEWRTTDPGLVLQQNDEVRFRVSGNFDGYLYVMNLNTSGQYALLFPRDDTGQANKIRNRTSNTWCPQQKDGFGSRALPGYETVYWLVSPVELRQSTH